MRALILLLLTTAMATAIATARDDEKDATKGVPPAKVDWGAFSDHIKLSGVVESATDTGLTVKVVNGYTRGRPPKPKYEEIELQYHESAQIRWPKLPPKLDETRKKLSYTEKEIVALRRPAGVPGYAALKSDLSPGARVEVQLLKPRGVPAGKLVTTDYKVKYVTIVDAGTLPVKK